MAKRKEQSKATTLAIPTIPALPITADLAALYKEGPTGYEEATSQDFQIPFLHLLQKSSPVADRDNPIYVDGAVPGQFWHQTRSLLIEAPVVIPCYYRKREVEWIPRESGGGFVAEHLPSDDIVKKAEYDQNGRNVLPNGHLLTTTAYFYCLMVHGGVPEQVVLALSSTQLKISRNWLSMSQQKILVNGQYQTLPLCACQYQLGSVTAQNKKGSWKLLKVTKLGETPVDLVRLGFEFAKLVESNVATLDRVNEQQREFHDGGDEKAF